MLLVSLPLQKIMTQIQEKYIPVSHLEVAGFSTEATSHQGAATNALDANYNTRWHSAWDGSDTKRFITVKLDQTISYICSRIRSSRWWKWKNL